MKITLCTSLLLVSCLLIWGHYSFAEQRSLDEREDETKNEVALSREKRAAGVAIKLLLGAALLTTTVNIGWAIYLDKNCCKISGVCKKQKQLLSFKDKFIKKADEIDALALEGSKQITFINSIHTSNEIIKVKLVRVITKIDELLQTLVDSDVNKLKEIQTEIDSIYKKNKERIDNGEFTTAEFEIAYEGVLGSTEGMLILFSPLMADLGVHGLQYAYKRYRYRQITKSVGADMAKVLKNSKNLKSTKMYKMLGSTRTSIIKKKTSLAKYKASFNARSKFKTGATAAFSLFLIGFELWEGFQKGKKCIKANKQIKENHKIYSQELVYMNNNKTYIKNANKEINKAYKTLTNSLKNDFFVAGIGDILNLVKGASSQNSVTVETAANLTSFIDDISSAVKAKNNDDITALQNKLSKALDHVAYTYDCFVRKAQAINSVITNCKLGAADLQTLYDNEKSKMETCVVESEAKTAIYLSFDTLKTAVETEAEKTGFSANCPLNSEDKKKLICLQICSEDVATVASNHETTVEVVKQLCLDIPCELSPFEKTYVCMIDDLEKLVKLMGEARRSAIVAALGEC